MDKNIGALPTISEPVYSLCYDKEKIQVMQREGAEGKSKEMALYRMVISILCL